MARVSTRLVIRRARLVRDPPADGATVVVEGGLITRVALPGEPVAPSRATGRSTPTGGSLVPGCVDAHTHLAVGALLRFAGLPGRYPGSPRALRQGFRRPVEERLAPADVEALATAAALAALRAGTTTVIALERAMPGEELATLEAAERAVRAVGIRALLAHGASDLGGADRGRASARAAMEFAAPRAADPLVRGMAGLDGLHATTRETLDALAEPAARFGIHASVGEDGSDLERSWGLERSGRSSSSTTPGSWAAPPSSPTGPPSPPRRPRRSAPPTPCWWCRCAPPATGASTRPASASPRRRRSRSRSEPMVSSPTWPARRWSSPDTCAAVAPHHPRGRSSSRSRSGRPAPRWRASSSGRGSESVQEGAAADLVILDWRPSGVEPEGRGGNAAAPLGRCSGRLGHRGRRGPAARGGGARRRPGRGVGEGGRGGATGAGRLTAPRAA